MARLRKRTPAAAGGRIESSERTRLWSALLLPGTLWMIVFFIGALGILVLLSFGTTDANGNPLFGTTGTNYSQIFQGVYENVITRSLIFATLTAAISLLIAYPVAYAIALHGGKYKNALIAIVVVPFFANYLIRMYGWNSVLSDNGPVLTVARKIGLANAHSHILQTPYAVVAGLVYGFMVFMVLPLYAALERMDVSLIEAGRDLGGNGLTTFLKVTVPATRQGASAGLVLVFLPAMGDFVSADFLGGGKQPMIGTLVENAFQGDGQNWPLGSALTMILMILLLLCTSLYVRQSAKDAKEAVR
jgi:spermidine/putrescine transport system permease protein